MSGRLEVQGIIAARPGQDPPIEAVVQFRQVNEDGSEVRWQQPVDEATEHARLVVESATNAAYEAAWLEWLMAEQKVSQEVAFQTLALFRIWRRDRWGQPDVSDWRES